MHLWVAKALSLTTSSKPHGSSFGGTNLTWPAAQDQHRIKNGSICEKSLLCGINPTKKRKGTALPSPISTRVSSRRLTSRRKQATCVAEKKYAPQRRQTSPYSYVFTPLQRNGIERSKGDSVWAMNYQSQVARHGTGRFASLFLISRLSDN